MRAPFITVEACRACGAPLEDLHAFGETPLADRLMRPGSGAPDYLAPLTLAHCPSCALCQIRETVEPRVLFGADYPYYSSVSPALIRHFRASAEGLIERLGLGPGSFVVEPASNDGAFLAAFAEAGIDVLGVDPADGPAAAANARGVPTRAEFFTRALAERVAAEGRRADLIAAHNVLAHVADTHDFAGGIAALLAEDGAVVIEAPYLLDLLDHREFDTIYHQHLLYLTLTSVAAIFAPHGLHLNDAERLRVHGGSLRMTLSRSAERSEALVAALAEEARRGVGTRELYAPFLADLAAMRAEMRAMLDALKAEGARVAGYGAAAKATTLCAWFGIDAGDLEAIADRNAAKQGWSMPGNGIPIVAPEALHADPPDVVLILAWNFANEIMAENADLAARFLVPVPRPRFVTAGAAEMAL